ncbi:MAG: ABC transporter substrate-binding protein [Proteobacteria bacterium]|nr:ABC transporter substrate-binding protein [Pseudomonadota bacterium]
MTHRRTFLSFMAIAGLSAAPAWAQLSPAEKAAVFVKATGDKLVAAINAPGSEADKRAALIRVVDQTVDVDEIARFCLGRYWRKATPDQQKQYVDLFRSVLVTNITAKMGQYQGVSFSMGRRQEQGEDAAVMTTVLRPSQPPTNVDWIISNPGTNPKIVDVKAEGTSLRLTQRQDYASFLSHNNEDIGALISAMRQQVAANK